MNEVKSSAPADGPPRGVPLLRVRGACKRFGAVQALQGVDLELGHGEVVAVLGENGAGKSTLMGVLAGSVQPDAGEIWIDGVTHRFHSPVDAQRAGVRLVPQELVLVPQLSAAENISLSRLPARRGRLDRTDMREQAKRRLAALGVTDLEVTLPVERLTVVQQAFVQIARAMVPGTRVLIVDEATAPMSGEEVEQLFGAIRRVAADGVGVLYISHRLQEISSVAGRIVVLRDGRLAGRFSVAALDREALIHAMVGEQDLSAGARASAHADGAKLAVRGLRTRLLADVDVAVAAGEIVSVYGVSGSGREELGPAVVGAIRRTDGEVLLDGSPITGRGVRASVSAGVGYVPAERRTQGLVLDRSIADNVGLCVLEREARHGLLRGRSLQALALRYVEQLDIAAASVDAPVRSLSGGSQQKVLFARCLAANSSVLVLDEPTRGVDVGAKAEIYRALRKLAETGVAVLIVSSDLEEVATIGDRVLVLVRGRIVAQLEGERRTQQEITKAALGVGAPLAA